MPELNRRRFLQLAGGRPPSLRCRAVSSRPPRSRPAASDGNIEDVEHIVVLMQENRSFDHYFGIAAGRPRVR